MNKYQKALDTINRVAFKQYEDVCYSKSKKSRAMNYESLLIRSANTLQELVDRATPMKPVYRIPDISWNKNEKLAHCPTCDWRLDWEQGCHNNKCRQRIDWSDENE